MTTGFLLVFEVFEWEVIHQRTMQSDTDTVAKVEVGAHSQSSSTHLHSTTSIGMDIKSRNSRPAHLVPPEPSTSSTVTRQDQPAGTRLDQPSSTSSQGDSLSTATVVGIIVASVLGVLLVAALGWLVWRKCQRKKKRATNMSWLGLAPDESQSFPITQSDQE